MNINPEFTPKQSETLKVLLDHTNGINEVLFGGAAGGAKSFLGCSWLNLGCLTFPGTRWVMGRAQLKNIKDTTLNTWYDVSRLWKLEEGKHWTFNSKDNIIRFKPDYGGSSILLKDLFQYPSDPDFDALGSLEITGAFVDEVSQITLKAKNILRSRIRYKLTDFCGSCAAVRLPKLNFNNDPPTWVCSTCGETTTGLVPKILYATNPSKNWAYDEFYKPWKEDRLRESRYYIPALAGDNKYLPDEYKKTLADLPEGDRQRLLLGNWEYDGDQATMIPYAKIMDVFVSRISGGQRFISADIARQGRDKTVVGVWDGFRLERIEELAKNKIPEAADLIKRLRFEHKVHWDNVCVDEDGVGGGVLDLLDDNAVGIVNNSTPLKVEGEKENFGNLKAQLYFYLAKYINDGKVFIRCTPEQREIVTRELEVVKKRNPDQDGKFYVLQKSEVKDLIGRSPDYSDMLAYRMYFELANQSRYV